MFRNGRTRFTFTGTLDARLQKGFTFGSRRLAAVLEGYNLLNMGLEVEEVQVTGALSRATTAVLPPRALHVGVRLTFRNARWSGPGRRCCARSCSRRLMSALLARTASTSPATPLRPGAPSRQQSVPARHAVSVSVSSDARVSSHPVDVHSARSSRLGCGSR